MNESTSKSSLSDELSVQRDTSEFIIDFLRVITQEGDYQTAMENALEFLSQAIIADRIYILEQQRRLDGRFFERCAEGVAPRIARIKEVSDGDLSLFVNHFRGINLIFAETLEQLGLKDPRSYAYFQALGINSLLVVALRENGRFVGTLCADNYTLNENIDVKRLLETIAPFLATVISNNQLLEELEWSVTHDPLTGLMNRRGIDAAMSAYSEKQDDAPFTLALIDIDDFKGINDTYGHVVGDEALIAISKALFEEFPKNALLGRQGGDELIAITLGGATQEAVGAIERFSKRLLSVESEGEEVRLTTSIGYTTSPSPALTVKEAYRQADIALYAVKEAGKGAAKQYDSSMSA